MFTYRKSTGLIIVLAFLLSACSNTRYLPEGETLFLGDEVKVKDKEASKLERSALTEDLENAVTPRPNRKVLGIRFKLTVYNLAGEPKREKGIRYWLRNKVGEPPALGSEFSMAATKQIQTNVLENRGFFYSQIEGKTETKKRKTKAYFEITTGKQYTLKYIEYVRDSSAMSTHIYDRRYGSLLQPGVPYNLELIKAERDRIDKIVKDIGYFYFKPDYLIMRVDTTVGDMKADVYVWLKKDLPEVATRQYQIKNIYILPDYDITGRRRNGNGNGSRGKNGRGNGNARDTSARVTLTDTTRRTDTLFHDNYYIVGRTKKYKPFIFSQAMQFEPGDWYSRKDQNTSLNRLVNMGTFKFVKNEFVPVDTNKLNAFYYLTSYPKKALRGEITGLTKNDSRVGSQLSLSWKNRNTLRGAELFTIKGTAGFETQMGGGVKRPNIYQVGIEPSLVFPRFVIPFMNPKSSSLFVPRTTARVGYDLLLREGLYRIHSFKAGYGYSWKEEIRKEHQFFPININYVRTDTLNINTPLNMTYSNLIFNGLIIGPTYQYTYNTRNAGGTHHRDYYFDGLIDLSGNLPGVVQGANVNGQNPEPAKEIFGAKFAQYAKVQLDGRYYVNYTPNINSIWANRIMIGYGVPYGNSSTLPNIKQFFSGGNSSLRGFPSRLVGPGEFHYNRDPNMSYIETAGDIKLELNTEVRTQFMSFLHGAAFIDAGNVWMYRESSLYPGGEFKFDRFFKQLAVSGGVGLRLDFTILVLRLDFGMPLRKPWLPEGDRWVFKGIKFGDAAWRGENIIFNLGIGYPF